MKFELTGGTISATIMGEGKPVILVHSLLADKGSFAKIIPPLAQRFRVIALDLPGFGESSPLDGNIVRLADHLAEALPKFCGTELPIVIGNGFGGFVSLQMAIRHPRLIDRLILADSGAKFTEAGRQAFRAMAAVSQAKGLEALADTAMRRLFSPAYQSQNPDLTAERRQAFLATNLETFQNACADLAALDLTEDVRTLPLKTLLLVGEQDEATPPAMSIELAGLLPHAKFTMLEGCAHVPQLQNPQLFLDAIADFMA